MLQQRNRNTFHKITDFLTVNICLYESIIKRLEKKPNETDSAEEQNKPSKPRSVRCAENFVTVAQSTAKELKLRYCHFGYNAVLIFHTK